MKGYVIFVWKLIIIVYLILHGKISWKRSKQLTNESWSGISYTMIDTCEDIKKSYDAMHNSTI